MSKAIQLTVAEPCHENWGNMTPDQQGRFCGSCQKQVVDFSGMSDRELLQFFKKPSTGSVCGRFMNDQLDRSLELPRKRIPWVSYFFQILLPALFVSKLSAQKTMGKPVARPVSDTIRIPVRPERVMMGMVVRTPVQQPKEDTVMKNIFMIHEGLINGKVTDQKGQPVPYASIDPGNGKARAADENGNFLLDATFLKNGQSVRVSSVNFETQTIFIDKEKSLRDGLHVQLEAKAALPEVIINAYMNKRICVYTMGVVSTTRQTTEITEEIVVPVKSNGLQVYPNPVASGSSLHLSFNQLKDAYYLLAIYSASGQLIQQKEIWLDANAKVLSLDLPVTAPGIYLLNLVNKETGEKQMARFVVSG